MNQYLTSPEPFHQAVLDFARDLSEMTKRHNCILQGCSDRVSVRVWFPEICPDPEGHPSRRLSEFLRVPQPGTITASHSGCLKISIGPSPLQAGSQADAVCGGLAENHSTDLSELRAVIARLTGGRARVSRAARTGLAVFAVGAAVGGTLALALRRGWRSRGKDVRS